MTGADCLAQLLRRSLTLCGVCGLVGCAQPMADVTARSRPIEEASIPVAVPAPTPPAATRANAAMARDFMELSFSLESGRQLEVMTRFAEPVHVGVAPGAPATLIPDLDALLSRLRDEAGIDIRRGGTEGDADIRVQAIPQAALARAIPGAACAVIPGATGWDDFTANRGSTRFDWTRLTRRRRAAVFVPADSSPQELRDCLHEEVAQALGPLADLYRLSDSVFNDDNMHSVLTGFDMLMLRAYYAPELANAMSRDAAARRLPELLSRLNPGGDRAAGVRADTPTPARWRRAIEAALASDKSLAARRRAAGKAVSVALDRGWTGQRAGFSMLTYGRLSARVAPDVAERVIARARAIFTDLPGAGIQRAAAEAQLAAFALADGRADEARRLIAAALPAARDGGKAALVATLMGLEADLLERAGRAEAAGRRRLDSLPYALYGAASARELGIRPGRSVGASG